VDRHSCVACHPRLHRGRALRCDLLALSSGTPGDFHCDPHAPPRASTDTARLGSKRIPCRPSPPPAAATTGPPSQPPAAPDDLSARRPGRRSPGVDSSLAVPRAVPSPGLSRQPPPRAAPPSPPPTSHQAAPASDLFALAVRGVVLPAHRCAQSAPRHGRPHTRGPIPPSFPLRVSVPRGRPPGCRRGLIWEVHWPPFSSLFAPVPLLSTAFVPEGRPGCKALDPPGAQARP